MKRKRTRRNNCFWIVIPFLFFYGYKFWKVLKKANFHIVIQIRILGSFIYFNNSSSSPCVISEVFIEGKNSENVVYFL